VLRASRGNLIEISGECTYCLLGGDRQPTVRPHQSSVGEEPAALHGLKRLSWHSYIYIYIYYLDILLGEDLGVVVLVIPLITPAPLLLLELFSQLSRPAPSRSLIRTPAPLAFFSSLPLPLPSSVHSRSPCLLTPAPLAFFSSLPLPLPSYSRFPSLLTPAHLAFLLPLPLPSYFRSPCLLTPASLAFLLLLPLPSYSCSPCLLQFACG
jgi:hypothetical protein